VIRWQLRDNQGNGLNVAAFQVVPEPSALVRAGAGAVSVWVAGRREDSNARSARRGAIAMDCRHFAGTFVQCCETENLCVWKRPG
jgi:hypothetical protein